MPLRQISLLIVAALGLCPAAAVAKSKTAYCLLVVDGFEAIRGPCRFEADSDGSFVIRGFNGKYFAYVSVTARGVADGFWNEEPYASHAQTPLGVLYREDACWTNETASVCAY
jgi:hypothetical protein